MNYESPREIAGLLEERGLSLKKRFGQNFLVARGARDRLVTIANPQPTDTVWEIGPGIGSMTELLIARVARLIAFEIDRGFVSVLQLRFPERKNLTIVPGDVLDTWHRVRSEAGRPDLIFGNLPYRSANLIIASLIKGGSHDVRVVATVQREVAERMAAEPGSKAYGGFSMLCQWAYAVELRGELKPGSFYPAPEVLSTVVELRPRDRTPLRDPELFFSLTRSLLGSRRKTIRNNLITAGRLSELGLGEAEVTEALEGLSIDPGCRAEQLSVDQVVALADRLAALRERSPSGRRRRG